MDYISITFAKNETTAMKRDRIIPKDKPQLRKQNGIPTMPPPILELIRAIAVSMMLSLSFSYFSGSLNCSVKASSGISSSENYKNKEFILKK